MIPLAVAHGCEVISRLKFHNSWIFAASMVEILVWGLKRLRMTDEAKSIETLGQPDHPTKAVVGLGPIEHIEYSPPSITVGL